MLSLKEIRLAHGKTQSEVAEYLNIARASYTNIENGKRSPDVETLIALADFYSVSIDSLLGRTMQEKKPAASEREHLSYEETELLRCFRMVNGESRKAILTMVTGLATNPANQKGFIIKSET